MAPFDWLTISNVNSSYSSPKVQGTGSYTPVELGATPTPVGSNIFASKGSGEIISDYGSSGASAGTYKGLNGPAGQHFDTLRDLGIYGF